jgi:Transposase IS66 family
LTAGEAESNGRLDIDDDLITVTPHWQRQLRLVTRQSSIDGQSLRSFCRATARVNVQWRRAFRAFRSVSHAATSWAIDALLLRGYFNALTYGLCKELVEHREHLWTFVAVEDIEPTNNAAERALRRAVIWRKLSSGTQSASGSRFVEQMLTVIETARRRGRNVFAWLTEAVQAHLRRENTPSLLAAA